jgi:bloom syndrome protein
MALTATATDQVAQDIINILMMKDCLRLQQSFNRPNLTYSVVRKDKDAVTHMAEWIQNNHPGETGVIYCLSQKDCEVLAEALARKPGISAAFYHAKMDTVTKRETQSEWQKGNIQVIVATVSISRAK